MYAAVAAYCSACNAYVFVSENGGCEFGHPRSSLRSLYIAEADRRSGRPKPPSRMSQKPARLAVDAPAAALADEVHAAGASGLPPSAPVVDAANAPDAVPTAPIKPLKEPRSPMIVDVAGAAIWPTDFMGLESLSRLLNPPRGKHSAPPNAGKPPRGRHSQGAINPDRETPS